MERKRNTFIRREEYNAPELVRLTKVSTIGALERKGKTFIRREESNAPELVRLIRRYPPRYLGKKREDFY